ncbi:MAG: hypothetical protein M3Q10_09055 [Chloroflexota bacterium]|nr:hypothetical protein [Chloroflexota bacterium]
MAALEMPQVPVDGVPADPTIIEAVTATIEEEVACLNSGDFLRAVALWTDELLRKELGGLDEAILAQLATPASVPPENRATTVSVDNVRVLNDGRVTAVTQIGDTEAAMVFVKSDGRYLIADNIELPDAGTPTP